jgi:CheY-like chemotaxis protein
MQRARPTALCVDDEPRLLRLVARRLAAWGFEVQPAASGEAVDLAEGAPLDLVVTDFRLPGMNGCELARRVRATHPTVKVLILSSCYQDELTDADSYDGYLQKPFSDGELAAAIARLVPSAPTPEPSEGGA